MNTSALKSFAPAVRRQLMEAITRKLDYVLTADTPDLRAAAEQVKSLRKEADRDRAALIERVAYTWFNRLAALRFLDARGWHPFKARVLTPATPEETQPELLKLMRTGSLPAELEPQTDSRRLNDLLDGRIPSPDAQTEVYRHLVLATCRFYHDLLPNLFEKLNDETEFLLPDDLLTATSIAEGFRTEISDDDCSEVEILGWLYQFYISDKKDQVMARKSAVPTEDIPAVTQLFTPHWIVRYLVENSLGRLWLLNRPNSKLREHMPYYIEDRPAAEIPQSEPPVWEPSMRDRGVQRKEGDYTTFLWLRPNPRLQGQYDEASGYALTIDGYAYAREKWGLNAVSVEAGPKIKELEAAGWEENSFPDLRCSLFIIQRGIKWSEGSGPTDELEDQFHACYAALCKVWDREWVPHKEELPVLPQLNVTASQDFLKITKPEEIRLCDPAVGSAHMLTYAFDLLTLIYEEEGYAPTEIPALILRHNLHGLEICPRAAQLAELALVFKAREKSRRFFQPEHLVRPHIIELRDVRFAENELRDYIHALGLGDLFNQPVLRLLHQFEEAKNFGSLIQPCLDERAIADVRRAIEAKDLGGQLFLRETHLKVLRVLEQAEALTQRYHVVVANPPYMGSGQMNASLKQFTKTFYPESKQDLMTCFMSRASTASVKNGLCGMINLPAWLFITSFEAFRKKLVCEQTILNFLHLGRGIFGSDFGSVAFVLENRQPAGYLGTYRRLFDRHVEVDSIEEKERRFLDRTNGSFRVDQRDFKAIDGSPIAYWISPKIRKAFAEGVPFRNIGNPRVGMQTSNNDRFLRLWHEVNSAEFLDEEADGRKWIKYLKGGPFRRWYGNLEYLLHYNNSPEHVLQQNNATILPLSRLTEPKCTWTDVTSGSFSCRWAPADSFHDISGHCFYPSKEDQYYLLAFSNTKQFDFFLGLVKSSMHCQVGDVGKMPLLAVDKTHAGAIGLEAVSISRADWDNFETSWDFRDQPLLRPGLKGATLEASWRNWEAQSTAAIRRMQELETENNRLFIAAYGLDGELQPEVPEAQITLLCNPASRYKKKPKKKKKEEGEDEDGSDESIEIAEESLVYSSDERSRFFRADTIREFLSYAVGCMMGRYSPDHPGLILANAGDSLREFLEKVGKPLAELPFAPDEDGIIPVLDGEWFEDDIVARTRDFLRATFGESTLNENVEFIETSLGKDLRKYFLTDFYKDHLQTYKKRPIYWLASSPQGSFQAVFYLHRYTRDTVNTLLNRYLREYLHKIEARIKQLAHTESTATNAREKTAARKEADKLRKALKECQDWERDVVLPLAQQRIELDLDDGVKTNYLKFPDLLAKIPGLEKKEEE